MSAPPLIVSCQSGSPLSREAARAVAELERRGLVRSGTGAEPAADETVVVLDGCASACAARRLAAEGHPAAVRLTLADCGVDEETLGQVTRAGLVEQLARRLELAPTAAALPRPHRPVAAAAGSGRVHGVDDYLLALDELTSPVGACGAVIEDVPTLSAYVSTRLGVTRPSAGEMLARLEAAGLVRRGAQKEILLTLAGRAAADRVIRRHRLIEAFVVTFLGFSLPASYERARALDPAFDDEAVEHLAAALGGPERCPHGWPVDPGAARDEAASLVALPALEAGQAGVVVRLREDAGPLRRLVAEGVVPGTRIAALSERGTCELAGRIIRLDADAAAAVLVRGRDMNGS